jgi:hypothetical protein
LDLSKTTGWLALVFGHYSASFVGKAVTAQVPLWVYFIAAQWLDIWWSLLVLLAIEKVRIVPGFTEGHPLDHYYMPYSHGLPGAILLSILFGGLVAMRLGKKRTAIFVAVSMVSFSHWVLDFLVHVPDLPLYGNEAKVGLGLWRHLAISLPLELGLLAAGALIYWVKEPANDRRGRAALWVFVAVLATMQVYVTFGPPPQSSMTMATTGLAFYVLIAAFAAWVERMRAAGSHVN